MDAAAKLTDCE